MSEEPQPTTNLREQVLNSLTGGKADCERVVAILASHTQSDRPNDIIYAVLLELELLRRVMEQIYVRIQEQHKVMGDNLIASFEEKNHRMMELTAEQQMISRSQFRRLVAIHRERFLIRLLLFSAMLLISLLAGLGVFYLYTMITG